MPSLLDGMLGSRRWMAQLDKAGGEGGARPAGSVAELRVKSTEETKSKRRQGCAREGACSAFADVREAGGPGLTVARSVGASSSASALTLKGKERVRRR